jgi:hypothetical protein
MLESAPNFLFHKLNYFQCSFFPLLTAFDQRLIKAQAREVLAWGLDTHGGGLTSHKFAKLKARKALSFLSSYCPYCFY